MKKLVVFDLDGTLAQSKSPLDAEMATLLTALLRIVNPEETKRVIETIIACLSNVQTTITAKGT
jgi:hydroxymethylpyrimidine pyrophosphatase-like HAD family hydrolase